MKKTLALGMAAAMTATLLAGCGGSSSSAASSAAASTAESTASSTAAASTAESTGSYTDYSAGFPENVTIQIPVYDRGFENWNPTDNYYTRWIQSEFGDKYNVTVKYVAIARSNEVQDFNQMIAAGNAPTIIFHYDMPAAVNYWSEGAEQPIDLDEVAYYAPTYWDNMKDTIETYGKLDGENAFIFAERDPIYYNWVTLIRKDWLDQVGLDVPTSNEELKTAMQAFKDAGLGVENAPLITKSFTYFYNWIPEGTSDDELAQYLDLNVAPFTWTATKNYLQDMNEKYNAGIVDPEFYLTTDDTLAKGKFVSGQCATYSFYMSSGTDVFSSLLANDPNAEVAVMGSTASGTVADGFTAHYYEYPSYGMIMGINANATAEERAATYMFLDWMSQPDNLKYLQYGEEGKTYNVVDGINVYNTDYTGDDKLSNNNNKDYWCLVQEVQHYGDEAADLQANKTTLAPAGYDWVVQDAYDLQKKGESGGIITPIFSKAVQATTEYSADLNSLWQEAYVDCVTCGPDEFESKYEEYCQEYLDAGYQEILDEKASLIADGNVLVVKYDATRPNDTLTRAEALELAIKALKLFPINVYNDLYSDIVGHETYAGTIQCAAQNDLIPPEWVADGSLYPNQTVTAADFLAVLIPGAAGRRPLADAVPVPDSVPVYARRAVGQAVAEGLIAPEALTKPLNRSNAAEICRRLHI